MRSEHSEIVEGALQAILTHYVFPETAAAIATHVRSCLADGRYHQISLEELASVLTADIQSVCHDQHVQIWIRADHDRLMSSLGAHGPSSATSAVRAEMLTGNVGYLEIPVFRSPETRSGRDG